MENNVFLIEFLLFKLYIYRIPRFFSYILFYLAIDTLDETPLTAWNRYK